MATELPKLSETPFSGKVVTITGAASGIGLATSLLLYERGATIAVSDVNSKALAELEQRLGTLPARDRGQRYKTTPVDVSDAVAVSAWIEETVNTFGRLDLCANIAGAGETVCNLEEKSSQDFDFAVNVNLRGVFNCMRAQLPHLQRGSAVVNVSSGSGVNGTPGHSLYSAAKGGVNTMTSAAAKEYGPKGIRINCVAPGVTLTPAMLTVGRVFLEPSVAATPLRRGSEPVEQAQAISFLLSDEASFITGVILRCDGGFAATGH
ncbi:uncharacterized protein Z518_04623 [Rhinocladiella mackenziei CBS 650.93]|uniref:Uncharacterized protein n=1 Tax=Rhinocladiella mackenziei CBS 650.93 TaxID=1442369 RepID=A0A0D2FWN2_9EURO|nr:uncharacterized protein Z518_04623 [Rhinocladiella mackenziei CBS 650.93]KIX06647.1 hypothetical protein Z518_04623 [Rhinocladiella mackenziei CBS 650.93]